MTPDEHQTLVGAIAHHNDMVRLYQDACRMREHGDNPLRSPIMGDVMKLGAKVQSLRKALAAFTVREMDAGNMGPYHVANDLLSTMRITISTAHGSRLPFVPELIGPDGIPERYRNARSVEHRREMPARAESEPSGNRI